jgi:hypothetical protein
MTRTKLLEKENKRGRKEMTLQHPFYQGMLTMESLIFSKRNTAFYLKTK